MHEYKYGEEHSPCRRNSMDKNYFVPINEHPEMYIGENLTQKETDNSANSVYSQDTEAWD